MKKLPISEFKARCLALLDEVARTGEPVTVLKRGKPLARVLPAASGFEGHPQERLVGTVEILGDILSPPYTAEAWEAESTPPPRRRRAAKP